MKVKNKLRLGFGFLFVVVLFFGAMSMFYIRQISGDASVILKDNYETLSYCRDMRRILDENALPLNGASVKQFYVQLDKEARNITEKGEAGYVKGLQASFKALSAATAEKDLQEAEKQVRRCLLKIEEVNMQAIVRKNDTARKSVDKSTLILGFAASIAFLALFSFSVNFPGIITGPLSTLLSGIRAIGQKNYKQRIHFDKNDEFGEVAAAFNEMARQLDDWENSNLSTIMSEKLRIETIIEQMHDAIIGVNEKQEILFVNTAARAILNLGPDRIEGKQAGEIAKSNDLFRTIIDDNTRKAFKIVVEGKDSHFQLETREISVPNLNNDQAGPLNIARNSAGKVYILRNITEFKERDEAKTNFIATISHELKTPISSIKMSLKLMKDERIGHVNTEQQQLLEHINDDSERLLKITSELLELSQVETGNIQLNFVPADPGQVVDYAISSVSFQADQKHVKLEVIKDAKLPQINADVEKTAWVLVNFLSNALRYSSEKSSVVIRVAARQNEVEFSVRDTGKGIDEQYQKRLFDRYFQVPTDGQNPSGSGLGLAISKDFIEAQQGKIWVKSAIGEGSTFGFSLPAAG
ncbi:ATP-binding protein [Mucilaginibacter sp. L3T2-6]|uniref:ATP-binding protein n=1 Tax=Mucilaginibacter sp. L3T2-6 TaxID=3062491 RepID=UPI002674F17C|nr:ATP-binding protein [Mucilaginibacter sp. L3T2-6]MDO3643892.1 ATP-binding protein [Mucilaginibacter sp. L3T2-6]MDV6216385.1 ATP-binding protein [Mucilaginibacter sp. L3T2-6]